MSWKLLPKGLLGLVALICANAYIVGINQIFDVQIDKYVTLIILSTIYVRFTCGTCYSPKIGLINQTKLDPITKY